MATIDHYSQNDNFELTEHGPIDVCGAIDEFSKLVSASAALSSEELGECRRLIGFQASDRSLLEFAIADTSLCNVRYEASCRRSFLGIEYRKWVSLEKPSESVDRAKQLINLFFDGRSAEIEETLS